MFTRSYVGFSKLLLLSIPTLMVFYYVLFITARFEGESAVSKRHLLSGVEIGLQQAPDISHDQAVTPSMVLTTEPVVPKYVHLIWFYPEGYVFRFHQVLCLLSIQRHLLPKRIIVWYSKPPQGPWWAFARKTLPNMALMQMEPPKAIFGRPVERPEHQSDITRLDVLLKYGGIYLDFDVIVLKPFDSLLSYDVTLGSETPNLLGNGIILARKNATFLKLWRAQYKDFDDGNWNKHSVEVPMLLARKHPGLVHVEWFTLLRPNWFERTWIYEPGKLWDWSDNYAIHLYYRYHNRDYDPVSIRTLNSTVGEIMRYVYYGSSKALPAR